MGDYMLLGLFDNVNPAADAVQELSELGYKDKDVTIMSNVPYSARLFGRKSPRTYYLPFVLAGAVGGALIAFFISVVTPSHYPLHVGAQELTPIPPSAIMYFEFMALGIMAASFIGFLLQGTFPILVRRMYDERITDGYIGIQVKARENMLERVEEVFRAHNPVDIKRDDADKYRPQGIRHLIFWALVGGGAATAGIIPLVFTYDLIDMPWFNRMVDTPAISYQEGPRLAAPAASIPIQGPTLIEDQPASARLEDTDVSRQRGAQLYGTFCAVCHGTNADGQSSLATKYYANQEVFSRGIPPLAGQGLSPDYLFTTITRGRQYGDLIAMPPFAYQLTPGETWDIVNYLLSLGAEQ